jgi:hypothetical protein
MPTTRLVLDAFINFNLLLGLALGLWHLARAGLGCVGLRRAHALHLRLLNGMFLALLASPLISLAVSLLRQEGLIAPTAQLSISDYALAQYLNGSFGMRPTEFEDLLSLRDTATTALLDLSSPVALGVAVAFGAGATLVLLRLCRQAIRVRRVVSQAYVWRRFGRIQLRLTEATSVPFSTRGIWRHYVVIPASMLGNRDDLRIAVAHEFQHLRQGDTAWEIVLEALRPLLFWNPAFRLWKGRVEALRELACDQLVLARRRAVPFEYADCLLRVCAASLEDPVRPGLRCTTVPLVIQARAGSRKPAAALRARVTAMLDVAAPQSGRLAGRLALLCLVFGVSAGAIGIQRQGGWSQDRLLLATIVNLERLDQRPGFAMRGY